MPTNTRTSIDSGCAPVALVGSSGGHLTHLLLLSDFWANKPRFWVTFKKIDAESALAEEEVYWCHFPTNRNLPNLIKNTFLAAKLLFLKRPAMVISSGAAVAVPFFYLARLMKIKTVYLEVYDRIDSPTLTGRLVYPVTDHFLIQWEEQRQFYPKGILVGELM